MFALYALSMNNGCVRVRVRVGNIQLFEKKCSKKTLHYLPHSRRCNMACSLSVCACVRCCMPFGEYIDFINQITKQHTTTAIIHYSMPKLFFLIACGVCECIYAQNGVNQRLISKVSHFFPLFASEYWHISPSVCLWN